MVLKGKVKIQHKVHQSWENLEENIKQLKGANYVQVGFFKENAGTTEDGFDIVQLASVHEFGANIKVTEKQRKYLHAIGLHLKDTTTNIIIPERSFLRSTMKEQAGKIRGLINSFFKAFVTQAAGTKKTLDFVGLNVQNMVQNKITNIRTPKNHPFTEKMKGSSNPLINTGVLRAAVTWATVIKGFRSIK